MNGNERDRLKLGIERGRTIRISGSLLLLIMPGHFLVEKKFLFEQSF